MVQSAKQLANLRPIDNSDEEINRRKSEGQINLAKEKNLIKTLRTRISETNIIENLVNGIAEETADGYYKNALKLLDIVKEPEKNDTTININQAVQVNKKDLDEAVNIINELR